MASYLRFGSGSSQSPTRRPTQPDFAAFDSDSDDEGDDAAPLRRSSGGGAQSPPRQQQQQRTGGAISLGDEVDDPLQLGQQARPNHHHLDLRGHGSVQQGAVGSAGHEGMPGGYDFEPQAHEAGIGGGGGAAGATRRDGSGGDTATTTRSSNGQNYRRPMSLRERLLPGALYARLSSRQEEPEDEGSGLLFSSAEETDAEDSSSSPSYPPRNSHVPLPARPPQFSAPAPGAGGAGGRVFGGGQGNDGVFANLSAKPDGMYGGDGDFVGGDEGGNKDEVLPAYEVAAMDTTPPYWETTVVTPGGMLGPDDICVDGLPVGNLFGFAWNLLVSMSFQFVGFLLTYLLHTTHAAKNGSRAGLGITLIQLGFYLKQRAEHPELFPEITFDPAFNQTGYTNPQLDPNDPANWSWWGGVVPPTTSSLPSTTTATALGSLPTQIHGALSHALSVSDPDIQEAMRNGSMPSLTGQGGMTQEELMRMSSAANEWMAFFMVTIGSFLVIGACLSYWRAVRWARAVRAGQGPGQDQENNILRSFLAH